MTGLVLDGLTVRYGQGKRSFCAVDHVDLSVVGGRTVGLVGESGCGKSSIARAIVGLTPREAGGISLDGKSYAQLKSLQSREYRRRVQMVFQDPYSALNPRMKIREAIAEAIAVGQCKRVSQIDGAAEVASVIGLVGLSNSIASRYPHELSGGQRQRIAIARAIAVQPEVMILDEVTSALDVSSQSSILNLLKELQRELHLSLLFISHDLSVVRYMSDEIAVMYLGKIVEYAPTDALFANPQHPYTRALISAVPQFGAPLQHSSLVGDVPNPHKLPSGCRFHARCPIGPAHRGDRGICVEADPQVSASSRVNRSACHFSANVALNAEKQLAVPGRAGEPGKQQAKE